MVVFFFFKQKTAYELRISDWSSDVCSSDLVGAGLGLFRLPDTGGALRSRPVRRQGRDRAGQDDRDQAEPGRQAGAWRAAAGRQGLGRDRRDALCAARRSEEHTSELQSLMRNSYAVFCLKKKTEEIEETTH